MKDKIFKNLLNALIQNKIYHFANKFIMCQNLIFNSQYDREFSIYKFILIHE